MTALVVADLIGPQPPSRAHSAASLLRALANPGPNLTPSLRPPRWMRSIGPGR